MGSYPASYPLPPLPAYPHTPFPPPPPHLACQHSANTLPAYSCKDSGTLFSSILSKVFWRQIFWRTYQPSASVPATINQPTCCQQHRPHYRPLFRPLSSLHSANNACKDRSGLRINRNFIGVGIVGAKHMPVSQAILTLLLVSIGMNMRQYLLRNKLGGDLYNTLCKTPCFA